MKRFTELQQNVINWAKERGIFDAEHGSTAIKQYLKFLTELGELSDAILKNNRERIKDGIGDCIVCLINAGELLSEPIIGTERTSEAFAYAESFTKDYSAEELVFSLSKEDHIEDQFFTLLILEKRLGFDENECLEYAYNEIKDRKGKMINGEFVKEVQQ